MKVILAAPELEGASHARAYISKTIDNLCLDAFRQEGRRPNLIAIEDMDTEGELGLQNSVDVTESLMAADDAALVRQALSLLSPAERAALVMWEIEGRSTTEIAKELGVKESTVRHTVSRARSSLRRILSEYIVNEETGITALDLLSKSYKKASKLAKDGTKVALSLAILIFAFLGFNNLSPDTSSRIGILGDSPSSSKIVDSKNSNSKLSTSTQIVASTQIPKVATKNKSFSPKLRTATTNFPGLDASGAPIGFSIADSSGNVGQLYFNGKEAMVSEDGIVINSIAKTLSGAANLFLTQSISQDASGVTLNVTASYGKGGLWIPLNSTVTSTDIERLGSGNYLLSASIQVKSEVLSTIAISAYAGGRDLELPPSRVLARILLNSSKTQVIGQAILVSEGSK